MIKKMYDNLIRRVGSLIYRAILIGYSIFILNVFDNNFSNKDYLIAITIYILSILFLLVKSKFPTARLVLDLSLIFTVLYGKDLDNIITISYIYLPIVNSPNHTGDKRSFFTLHLLTLLVIILLSSPQNRLFCLLPMFCYAVVGFFENTRNRLVRFGEDLYSNIDKSYFKNIQINKTHRLYRDIITTFKDRKYHKYFPLENIYCIKIDKDRIVIINTSSYTFNIEIELSSLEQIIKAKRNQFLRDLEILIDKRSIRRNRIIKIKYGKTEYIFICELSEEVTLHSIFGSLLIMSYMWQLVFSKVARILEMERNLKDADKAYKDLLKENLEYIGRTRLAMHFLRNKFSPIKTYLQLSQKIKICDDLEQKERLRILLEKSESRAIHSMDNILLHTDNILEGYERFSFHETQEFNIAKLFSLTRTIWDEAIDSGNLINNGWGQDQFKEVVNYNENGLYIVILDIVENLRKYNSGEKTLEFNKIDNKYTILFKNNFPPEKHEYLQTIASEFMSDDITEIALRKTHGLSMIKQILSQMNIHHGLSIKSGLYVFEISFVRSSK